MRRNIIRRVLVTIGLVLVYSNAFASAEWLGGSNGTSLDRIEIDSNGDVMIFSALGDWDGQACSDQSAVVLANSAAGFEATYSALLAAVVGEKKIRIQTVSCTGGQSLASVIRIVD